MQTRETAAVLRHSKAPATVGGRYNIMITTATLLASLETAIQHRYKPRSRAMIMRWTSLVPS